MQVLLFDMDGVLVDMGGYHGALRETVAEIGRLLGYRQVCLSPDAIAAFEAIGVTNEWDSSAICAALLLSKAWEVDPGLRFPGVQSLETSAPHDLAPPDFMALIEVMAKTPSDLRPLRRAEIALMDGSGHRWEKKQVETIRHLLDDPYDVSRFLTVRIQQEFVLGSETFAATYGLPSRLNCASYLLTHDRPTLSAHQANAMLRWLEMPDQYAAIFTNRPSSQPENLLGTPEAELGARVAGLENLPMVALGGAAWLGESRGQRIEAFFKPSPVHVLAALRHALGASLEEALLASAALVYDGEVDRGWEELAGVKVSVFEDAAKGLESAKAAQKALAKGGIPMDLSLYGVTENSMKARSLEAEGGSVYADLPEALEAAGVFLDRGVRFESGA